MFKSTSVHGLQELFPKPRLSIPVRLAESPIANWQKAFRAPENKTGFFRQFSGRDTRVFVSGQSANLRWI